MEVGERDVGIFKATWFTVPRDGSRIAIGVGLKSRGGQSVKSAVSAARANSVRDKESARWYGVFTGARGGAKRCKENHIPNKY